MKFLSSVGGGIAFVLGALVAPAWAGSLYDPAGFQSLTGDRKARRVGDLVTVLIYENASASSTADTSAGHDAGLSAAAYGGSQDHKAGLGTANNFDGRGRTERSGRVLGQLTVIVQDAAPNGDLLLAGTQELEINGEKQVIRLEGRVRSQDVSEANTVLSTRVADARITFAGDGVLAQHQKPSWWHRLLTLFGL